MSRVVHLDRAVTMETVDVRLETICPICLVALGAHSDQDLRTCVALKRIQDERDTWLDYLAGRRTL